jgi:hypothetical protein
MSASNGLVINQSTHEEFVRRCLETLKVQDKSEISDIIKYHLHKKIHCVTHSRKRQPEDGEENCAKRRRKKIE